VLFSSYIFWAFFAVVLFLYRRGGHRWQNRLLLVASYVFYGAWDWRFLSLIALSTVVDYFVAIGITRSERPGRRKWLLALSVGVNLALLGTFKYFGFFAAEMVDLLGSLGLPVTLPSLKFVLPVGISFYTFQTMSYTIDVYRGVSRPVRHFLDFALYVAFFPQLVAGPIERSYRLMPQIVNPRPRRGEDFVEGLYLVILGLFKKIVIADNMAVIVVGIFGTDPDNLSGLDCLVGVYAFAFQIYGDFSGYSAIARGVAKWMGFDLMTNFNAPYLARSPGDFWRRWHISLSTWLRDYLYIPLGGNRKGTWRTRRNLMVTMLLGGLWHGAGWTFVAWGLFHGLLLCAFRPFEARRRAGPAAGARRPRWRAATATLIMFHLICFGWLLFRAESMGQAWTMLTKMVLDCRATELTTYGLGMIGFLVGPLMLLEYWVNRTGDLLALTKVHWLARAGVYSYFTVMLLIFQPMVHSAFIYFQF